jgi:hypothetical protein
MSKKSTREEAVELAYASAQEQLRAADPKGVAERSGAELSTGDEGQYLKLTFLNRHYRVLLPDATVSDKAGEEPPLVRKVLILHYLLQAHGEGLAGRWVDFRSLSREGHLSPGEDVWTTAPGTDPCGSPSGGTGHRDG